MNDSEDRAAGGSSNPPSVSVVHCAGYALEKVSAAVRRAVDLQGGISAFVQPGQKVLLKPNLLVPRASDKAVSTHPSVILATAELCQEAGARVSVGDSPALGSARGNLAKLGIADQLEARGIEIVEFFGRRQTSQPDRPFPRLTLSRTVLEADVLINLAKVKTHALMVLTLATKNLYGTLVGLDKARWHLKAARDPLHFSRLVLELARLVKPAFSIVDGVTGMEGNGPSAGTPRQFGAIFAGTDTVALDTVIADILGVDPSRFPLLMAAKEGQFGETDSNRITLLGDPPDSLRVRDWKLATRSHSLSPMGRRLSRILNNAINEKPVIDAGTCTMCETCVEHCPADAMSLGDRVEIDYGQCVRCFCCQEICPESAITTRPGWARRLW